MKYILVYIINESHDRIEYPADSDLLDKRINEIIADGYELVTAGELKEHNRVAEIKRLVQVS